jgi:predicted esterase
MVGRVTLGSSTLSYKIESFVSFERERKVVEHRQQRVIIVGFSNGAVG